MHYQGELTRFYVTIYREYLLDVHYTINKKVDSLDSFNQFLIHQGLCEEQVFYPNKDKFKMANVSESEVEFFSGKEVEQILFYLEDRKNVSYRIGLQYSCSTTLALESARIDK